MMTVEVFHTAFEDAPVHVATLTSERSREEALDDAFTGTQNLESPWVESRGQNGISITPAQRFLDSGDSCRSSAMGDYARVVEGDVESFFRCCAFGWKEITNREELASVREDAILKAL